MTQQFVVHFAREAIYSTFLASGPILILALVIGLIIGVFQAVTSINEMTLTFVPKILIVMVAMVFFAPWIMNVVITFTQEAINQIPNISH